MPKPMPRPLPKRDFSAYAEQLARVNDKQFLLPVIEKELLHYEILIALERAGLLAGLVFQGGTCLRLCYGAVRFSEDLDFAGGSHFDASDLSELKHCLEKALSEEYLVETHVQEPSPNDQLVKKWRIKINTAPTRPDLPSQRISLEVASVPAYTKQPRALILNYEGLNPSYADLLLHAESLEEILADKLEAFVCSSHLRHRDIWDLQWLARQPNINIKKAQELRKLKERDYQETKIYQAGLVRVNKQLASIVESSDFAQQMMRFLPSSLYEKTIASAMFRDHLVASVQGLYGEGGGNPTCD